MNAALTLSPVTEIDQEIATDLVSEIGIDAAIDEVGEQLRCIDDALADGELYPFEIDALTDERRELQEYLARLGAHISGAPDQRPGERTLNEVATERGDTMADTLSDFRSGVLPVCRWAHIGAREFPRF